MILQSLKSRTMWVGILEVVGGVAYGLSADLTTGGAVTVAGIATIILRAITKTPLSEK